MNYCRITDLRRKEVVSSQNGCRLGIVDDIEFDTVNARLAAIILYGRPRFFGLFGRRDDLLIRWENIELIGEDTILVKDIPSSSRQNNKGRLSFLGLY